MLNLTWSEIGLVGFLFALIYVVGYLPKFSDLLADWGHRSREADGAKDSGPPKPPASAP